MATPDEPQFPRISDIAQLGALCRAERKRQGLTLDDVYAATGLSTRFLSEFERGKPHVSATRVLLALQSLGLDAVVVPREQAARRVRESGGRES